MSASMPAQVMNTKPLFKLMVEKKASDLFFTSNAPIKIKIEGQILPVNKQVLTPETVRQTAYALMSNEQREHFLSEWELDFAVSEPGRRAIASLRPSADATIVRERLRATAEMAGLRERSGSVPIDDFDVTQAFIVTVICSEP